MSKEIWKDIPEYENLYQVSNQGRVYSLPKEWISGWNNVKRKHDGIIFEPQLDNRYLRVGLTKNKKRKFFRVHRLVLSAFCGDSNLEANHINGIKTDNRLENLEWVTPSENMKHAYKTGLKKGMKGESHPNSKLNEDIVKNIRENRFKLTVREFAACYDVSEKNIYNIITTINPTFVLQTPGNRGP